VNEPRGAELHRPGGGLPLPIRGLVRLSSWLNAVGTIGILLLMALVNADILGREFFSSPVRGTTEILSLTIVAIVFLQLAHCLWVGRFTRNDAVPNFLAKKLPRTGVILDAGYHLIGAGLMMIIFWASLPFFAKAWRIDEYVGAFGDFTAPVWPVKLIILIGAALTALMFAAIAWQKLKTLPRLR
jgi:TRAP-type mannitol/chloroaromatic compound transport system permease small subunit